MNGAPALSPAAQCSCGHTYGQHALHVNTGERVCIALVPARRSRRPAAKPGEGVATARRDGGVETTGHIRLTGATQVCTCESFSLALCPHGEEAWQGCPACRDDEYDTRLGELER